MKKPISRREALQWISVASTAFLAACQRIVQPTQENITTLTATAVPPDPTAAATATEIPPTPTATPAVQSNEGAASKVYMITDISPEGLARIYDALARPAGGKVAVKISSGEPGGHYYLSPELIGSLVEATGGTIVECNTAYGGGRSTTEQHLQVMEDHGFTAIAPVDIMDSEGTMSIPVSGGSRLTEDIVGSHFVNYDFYLNLAHFKGHQMAGFGGVLKNMSIGIAAAAGKSLIHTAGQGTTGFGMDTPVEEFLEAMAEAAKGVADYLGENIVYIDIMNNLSVDCDCNGSPSAPTMADIGILGSLDPVALDQACVDLIYAAPDGSDLIARMESRSSVHVLEHAELIGLGSRKYEIVSLD